jgi:fibronectin type 3 domain-containing protein
MGGKMKRLLLAILFVLMSVGIASGESIKLVWDPNSEPDLAGYKIYSSRTDGGPYALLADVGNVTEYEMDMAGETDGTIYYVATAYDERDNESDYSNQADYMVDHTAPQPPGGCRIILEW